MKTNQATWMKAEPRRRPRRLAPADPRSRRPRGNVRDMAIDAVAGGEDTEVEAQFLAEIRAACTVNAHRGGDGAAALHSSSAASRRWK